MDINELPTPQVLVDAPRLRRNIERMQAAADQHGLALRPHTKTHKSPVIARLQIDRGARGICCAKLGEAEVFADAGFPDIRLPYPVNPFNADRVVALLDRVRLSFIVDHEEVARGWSAAMQRAGRTLDVLVKVDVGFHRCGIDPHAPGARAFLRFVHGLPGLRLRGLLAHAGHGYLAGSEDELRRIAEDEASWLRELKQAVEADGVPIEEVSVGATPTFRFSVSQPGLTEIRPGNYVYYDRTQVALHAATLDDCALSVVATVVARPAADRVIFDSGSKTLTSDGARGIDTLAGYGAVLTSLEGEQRADDRLVIERLSEEHATVRVVGGMCALRPGDRVRIVPNHSCTVSNLVDVVRLVEGMRVVETLPVTARGKIQ